MRGTLRISGSVPLLCPHPCLWARLYQCHCLQWRRNSFTRNSLGCCEDIRGHLLARRRSCSPTSEWVEGRTAMLKRVLRVALTVVAAATHRSEERRVGKEGRS